jgi:hypothetical protein
MLAIGTTVLGFAAWPSALLADAASQESPAGAPSIPDRLLWPGVVVIVVIAIFVTAALAGPIIRANNQDEIPDSDSQEPHSP